MPFLPPNQQRQSTEGSLYTTVKYINKDYTQWRHKSTWTY